jgi:hypothetical protein
MNKMGFKKDCPGNILPEFHERKRLMIIAMDWVDVAFFHSSGKMKPYLGEIL